ncbi:hypothetical protein U1Q18_012425 [Sarracenia purpurea var. burkii]
MASSCGSAPHIVLFPFMSKGHTIPLLHLARLLRRHRDATVTIFTTPANRPFISDSLADTAAAASIVDLPFPQNIDGVPPGVESTEKLPSMSTVVNFATATKLMQPRFEQALQTLHQPSITCIISDMFLGWTLESASKFSIPRLVFNGFCNYSLSVSRDVIVNRLLSGPQSDEELFAVTSFPWINLSRNDFEEPFNVREPKGPHMDFIIDQVISTSKSHGLIMNSFYKLERTFVDYWNRECESKVRCIGPLCLAAAPPSPPLPPGVEVQSDAYQNPAWLNWLDQKLAQGSSVLYVAFGTQAMISSQQLKEIAIGLEDSKVNFLWVLGKSESEFESALGDGFGERVKERGLMVREWVDQREILEHESVKGFLSHCGWNSVLESICAKVPILAWPLMAEQHLNARMVVEELGVGLRVETANGSVRGFVKWESLEKTVRELMEGEMGKGVRKKVEELGEAAAKAVEVGGSSWHELNQLIDELQTLNKEK